MKRIAFLAFAAVLGYTAIPAQAFEVQDGAKLPASYAREVETKDKDGKPVKTLVFNGAAATIPPADLHAILTAYGAKVADGAKLPASYAREVETKTRTASR
jgi:hypothetical protein